jgi:hypothetical protein
MATYKATLTKFTIDLPFLRSEFESLNRLGEYAKVEENVYRWSFPLCHMKEVIVALNGSVIEFDKEHLLQDVIPYCDPLVKELEIEVEGRGKGKITVCVDELVYHVEWTTRGTKMHYAVAKALIERYWFDAMADLPVGKPIHKRELMERMVMALEKHHWDKTEPIFEEAEQGKFKELIARGWKHVRTGNFNYKYLQGDRANDIKLWYAPVKVMVGLGLVEHTFGGYVIKLVETKEFDSQKKFGEMKLYQQQVEEELNAPEHKERGNILKWAEGMK